MKKTTLTLPNGLSVTIAPLNMAQVEALMDAETTTDPKALRLQTWGTVLDAIANAGDTREREDVLAALKNDLDLPSFSFLRERVMEVSGLTTGEAPAARNVSTSNDSVAA